MPWIPEIELARASVAREGTPKRVGFYVGLETLSTDELLESFSGAPDLDDPQFGRVTSKGEFRSYVADVRRWQADQQAGHDPVALTKTPERSIEELSIRLKDGPRLPVAISTDFARDGRIRSIRLYYGGPPAPGTGPVAGGA